MKYAPLIWTALWRKPTEALLTLLALVAAFTLLGLMVGLRSSYHAVIDSARLDRIEVRGKFPGLMLNGLPIALADKLAATEGVVAVGAFKGVGGYYRDRKNSVELMGLTDGMRRAWSELPLTPEQWDKLAATPYGAYLTRANAKRLQVKEGDAFPIVPESAAEVDGRRSIDLTVLGVIDDDPQWDYHQILTSYNYLDQLRPPEARNGVWVFRLAIRDPTRGVEIGRQIDRSLASSGTPTRSSPTRRSAQLSANYGLPLESLTWTVGAAGLFVVLLLIGNAIAESVDERIGELAVLMSLGFSQNLVRALVFAEALLPCLAGALLGGVLASRLSELPRAFAPQNLAVLPPEEVLGDILLSAAAFAVLLALVASVAPLRKLTRLDVAAALSGRRGQ